VVNAPPPLRIAALVPTYDNPRTVRGVVARIREQLPDVLVVDDGSGEAARTACAELARDGLAQVHHLPRNGGKGAAMKVGFGLLQQQGFTHALQVDADGQHDLAAIPTFVQQARQTPDALVLAYPVYDATVPKLRLMARELTRFWVDVEVGKKGLIRDALIGFRVYPLASTLRIGARGNRMEYEVEIAVRMARAGVPIVNLPVGVRYLRRDEGGVSHFRPFADNLRLSWMHARICTRLSMARVFGWLLPERR
jgi:glycosyltransferase involved in cell wall biosynthesis